MTTITQPTETWLKKAAIWVICGLLALLFLAPIAFNIYEHLSRPPLVIPDEQLAGQELLAKKFAGPLYFQPEQQDAAIPPSDKYYITVASARSQAARIAVERKLNAAEVAKLHAIIENITEPPPSRVVGQDRVSTVRLNLALDALR